MPEIHTVVSDIYSLFTKTHVVNDDNLEKLKQSIGDVVKKALEQINDGKFTLRMSNIGTPDRKLWYDSRDTTIGIVNPKDQIKFLYGHILEALLIFFIREAGHDVTEEQKCVELNGIPGHKDCRIDGVLSDVKSASSYQFNKFRDGSFPFVDPFGYKYQLKGYYEADTPQTDELAWFVIDKTTGELALLTFHPAELPSASERIEHVKQMLNTNEPPERCYAAVADDNGNISLPKNCEWCKHKFKCWDNLRVFQYSNGPKYFVNVVKEPRVQEITHETK